MDAQESQKSEWVLAICVENLYNIVNKLSVINSSMIEKKKKKKKKKKMLVN